MAAQGKLVSVPGDAVKELSIAQLDAVLTRSLCSGSGQGGELNDADKKRVWLRINPRESGGERE
jgi:hypothetical protein